MSEGLSIKNNFLPGYPGGVKSILRIAIIIILWSKDIVVKQSEPPLVSSTFNRDVHLPDWQLEGNGTLAESMEEAPQGEISKKNFVYQTASCTQAVCRYLN
jgi:hypothetical protein